MANPARITPLELERALLDAEVEKFIKTLLPRVVDRFVRAASFDVVANTIKGLNGIGGVPKRIDTGRLRAGWRVALQNAGLPTTGLPTSSNSSGRDGSAVITGRGLDRTVTVQNNVEYAKWIENGTTNEDGTVRLAPGRHLERALRILRKDIEKGKGSGEKLDKDMHKAWGG